MALREARGTFRLEEPVSPPWEELPVPGDLHTHALVPGHGRELWALVRPSMASRSARALLGRLRRAVARRSRPDQPRLELHLDAAPLLGHRHAGPAPASAHVLAWRPDGGWSAEVAFAPCMDALAVLHDGTVAAGGDGLLALRSGDGTWREHTAPARLTRVWGASADCLYAFGEREHGSRPLGPDGSNVTEIWRGLFYFDGRTWAEIDLAALDIPGYFADGACDESGYGWVVGTYGTHSCMARGKGTAWERDGCSSFYLDMAHADPNGRAYALGGDGLWRLQDRWWLPVESFGHDIGWPLALADVGGLPWVLWSQSLIEWMGPARSVSGVDLFMAGFWVTLMTPRGSLDQRESLVCTISPRGEVCLAAGSGVWRSPPLEEVVPRVWPPQRLTPEDDLQLVSGEPLVRGWSALEGSAGLTEWAWLGRGLIGAVKRSRGTALVRWRELSQPPESIGEFDFRVGTLTPAPGDRQVVLVPQVITDEGYLGGARRLVFVDVDSGGTREIALPPGFEYDEFTTVGWSPDGSRFLVRPRRPLKQEHDEVLIFRADDLILERTVALPPGAWFRHWAAEGLEVALDTSMPGPFREVPAAWVDPATGLATKGKQRLAVSPSGRYRVAIEWGQLKITTMADGVVRHFAPTRGGLLDLETLVQRAAWVGDRLELTARLLGPVHLDLATLRLHYALPVRKEFDAEPRWSPDGISVLKREPDSVDPVAAVPTWSWSWGVVYAVALG